jgi:hypothetical protein
MSAFDRFVERLFNPVIRHQVKAQLSVLENDATFSVGAHSFTDSERDRYTADREELLSQSLDAWRLNPLARRIVELTSEYVVGSGISVACRHAPTARFLDQFWNHRLNRMPIRVFELCDELTRSGNLFMLLSTDESGMTYLRAIPAVDILKIEARENDIEQPVAFFPKSSLQALNPEPYPAYDPLHDDLATPVMLQYAINRPSGGQWGESDLAPLLRWLSRYTAWKTAPVSTVTEMLFCISYRLSSIPKLSANNASRPSMPIPPSPAPFWSPMTPRIGRLSIPTCIPLRPMKTGWP